MENMCYRGGLYIGSNVRKIKCVNPRMDEWDEWEKVLIPILFPKLENEYSEQCVNCENIFIIKCM